MPQPYVKKPVVSKPAMDRFLRGRGSKTGGKTKTPGTWGGRMVKPPTKKPVPGLKIGNRGKGY